MKVKRLEINGFKSFADRTILDLDEGPCAVVGPNGCGKSNVVDAVRWVLGEQSARQLRGKAMEDVIFNGAQGRKAAGMAEVSITFENQGDVAAPQFADLSEIMLTRRLYRSGESEYLINRQPARLKDIQTLLMGTGLGNRAYAIIEQGKVGAFIEARPEERRLWLEEAAGITSYKNQKKVSMRKMEAAQENMDRLTDIMLEVETQMKRLERQSVKAQRHKVLKDEIRQLDLAISSSDFRGISEKLKELGAESDAVGSQVLLANQRVTVAETDLETMKARLVSADQVISRAASRRLEAQGAIQKAENELSLLGREMENQKRLKERYEGEMQELHSRLQYNERELAKSRRLLDEGEGRLAASRDKVEEAAERVRVASSQLSRMEEGLYDAKDELVGVMSSQGNLNNRLGDLERSESDLARRREQLSSRKGGLMGEIRQMEEARAQTQHALDTLSGRLAQLQARLDELSGRRQEVSERLKVLKRREEEATRNRHDLKARCEALSASLASRRWAGDEVRKVLEAQDKGQLPVPTLGLVADHLEVAQGMEGLVEAALGSRLQAVVVADGEKALALAAWAQERKLGGLELVSLADLSNGLPECSGGATPLDRAVKASAGCEALANLVSGAAACDDLASAWGIMPSLVRGQVLVTRQGQLISRKGALSLGRAAEVSVLAKKGELARLQQELGAAEEEAAELAGAREQAQEDLAGLDEEMANAGRAKGSLKEEMASAEQGVYRAEEGLSIKRRQLENLDFDADELAEEGERLVDERARLEGELERLAGEVPRLEERLAQSKELLADKKEEMEELREEHNQAQLAAAALSSQVEQASREEKRLASQTNSDQRRYTSLQDDVTTAAENIESFGQRKSREQEKLGQLYLERDELEQEYIRAKEEHGQVAMQVTDLEATIKQARAELKEVEKTSGDLEWKRRELSLRREQLCDQVLERCRVDLTTDHESHLPEGAFDLENSRGKLVKMRDRLQRMGPVNLEAISEHESLSERHAFLTEQKDDLDASLADLRKAIHKINKTSRGRFMETLEEVNKQLAVVYPVLFGGGGAFLELEPGVDPLEAGLHILAEIPGKKIKNLESMSGGEKALTAAAVLFALFLIRPAPFCILDEVDAPLDEANAGRFHELLLKLSERSQIMLITHNRRTMEITEVLYGVTMAEKGVSKLLTVSLARAEALAA